jgi:transposase
MPSLLFTPSEVEQIDHDRFYHPCPQIQRRMEVLRLAAHGLPQAEIAQLTGLSKATIQRRLADFRRGRLHAVGAWNYRGRPSILHQHAPTLEEYFRSHPPATVADARAVIEEKTGVRRGLTQVRLFLKKIAASAIARPAARRRRPIPSPRGSSTTTSCNPC